MMIHPAIDDHEFFPSGNLYVVDARNVNASLCGQKPAGLHHKLRSYEGRIGFNFRAQRSDSFANPFEVEFLLVGKIRDAQAPTKVDRCQRSTDLVSSTTRDFNSMAILVQEYFCVEDLGAGKHMYAAKIQGRVRANSVESLRQKFFVN